MYLRLMASHKELPINSFLDPLFILIKILPKIFGCNILHSFFN